MGECRGCGQSVREDAGLGQVETDVKRAGTTVVLLNVNVNVM